MTNALQINLAVFIKPATTPGLTIVELSDIKQPARLKTVHVPTSDAIDVARSLLLLEASATILAWSPPNAPA